MERVTNLTNKLTGERVCQITQQLPPSVDTAPPPAYTASENEEEVHDDDDDDGGGGNELLKLIINAQHTINGSNNLVPTSPMPLTDAIKFSTILLNAINHTNGAAQAGSSGRKLHVDLTINCGITIVGERNVVGNVGLKPKATVLAGSASMVPNAVTGAKRKAEDDTDPESNAKRAATDAAE